MMLRGLARWREELRRATRLRGLPKIFGIGLSRTGTKSLSVALNALGIRTVHYPQDPVTRREIMNGQGRLTVLSQYQGICDIVTIPVLRQLDSTYPGSRFILTLRDLEPWLESYRRHYERHKDDWFKGEYAEFLHLKVYGTKDYDEPMLRRAYARHYADVLSYFSARPTDLLIFRPCHGDGWNELCSFLRLDTPAGEFQKES
jgi:hypothetical protein